MADSLVSRFGYYTIIWDLTDPVGQELATLRGQAGVRN